MRLIDADALKEEVNKKKVVGRFNTLLLIDNAPTVEEKSYAMGYQDGLEDGLDGIIPKGEWIFDDYWHKYKCSICGRLIETEVFENPIDNYPFCHCGAKMGGAE